MDIPLFKNPVLEQNDTNTKERRKSMVRMEYELMMSVSEVHNAMKDAAIPVQVWRGPEGSSGLKLEDCKTVGT